MAETEGGGPALTADITRPLCLIEWSHGGGGGGAKEGKEGKKGQSAPQTSGSRESHGQTKRNDTRQSNVGFREFPLHGRKLQKYRTYVAMFNLV